MELIYVQVYNNFYKKKSPRLPGRASKELLHNTVYGAKRAVANAHD